ncbi:WAT1-related protein At2g39510-like [Humulus lupulus]|uniref:WAT1-related protein At2g39510-like n=1 Tax=Humulus lupulus TaxID=3486 RepID=UPI002B4177CD|nr:WAT1-related protein At2g39510-like [Humulus lupulus]
MCNSNSNSSNKCLSEMLRRSRPFVLLIVQQFGVAGMNIITKFAINEGKSQLVLVVYRHVVAAIAIAPFAILLERKTRPKMTYSIFGKIMLLGLLEPVMDQNLYYTGMKYTTATFATAMLNLVPAFVFVLAWIFRLEDVKITSLRSHAKMLGTIVTLGGAMVMALFNGPPLNLPWTKQTYHHDHHSINAANKVSIKGALMIISSCVCCAFYVILQAVTLKTYPAELSLTTLICLTGAIQGAVLALGIEWGNPSAWSLNSKPMLAVALYGGVFRSGLGYYIQGLVMKDKGPVFVTAFNPLGLVVVAIISSFILSELMYLGRVIGAVVIIFGLYMVLWGKSKDKPRSKQIEQILAPTRVEHDLTTNKKSGAHTKISNQELVVIEVEDPDTNLSTGTKPI